MITTCKSANSALVRSCFKLNRHYCAKKKEEKKLTSDSIIVDFLASLSNSSSWHLQRFIKADIFGLNITRYLDIMLVYCKMRIHFRDDNDCILLLKSIMKVNNSLMVQCGEQVHLPQSRCLLLGSCGHKFGSILHFSQLLRYTFHIGKCSSAAKTRRETLTDQWSSILKQFSSQNM